jgi:hypothetical protein
VFLKINLYHVFSNQIKKKFDFMSSNDRNPLTGISILVHQVRVIEGLKSSDGDIGFSSSTLSHRMIEIFRLRSRF